MIFTFQLFNCRVVDTDLALGYCLLLSKPIVFEKLWNIINDARQNFNKILVRVTVCDIFLNRVLLLSKHLSTSRCRTKQYKV